MARMVNVEDIVFDLSGLQFIPPTDFRAIGEYFARQLRELPVIDLTKEELLPDGTLHLFTDTDLSKVDRVLVSQNGTHFGDLYYADGEPKIGKWIIEPYDVENDIWVHRCGECMKVAMLGSEKSRFNYCPYCGARMQEGEDNDRA